MTTSSDLKQIERNRARRTAVTIFACIAVLCALYLIRAVQWQIDLRIISLSTTSILCAVSAWAIYRGYEQTIWVIVGLFAISLAAGVSSYSSGGIHNASIGWVLLVPLLGGLAGGTLTGMAGVGFAIFTVGGLFYLDLTQGSPPDLTPAAYQYSQERLHQFAQIIIMSIAMVGFLRQRQQANELVAAKVGQLTAEVEARTLAEAETQRANEAKTEFLANMSHEIRTPMHGVQGVLELLNSEALTDNQRDLLEIARRSSNNMLQIINEILDISKIESGKLRVEAAPFDLASLFKDVEASMTLSAHRMGLRLCVETDLPHRRVVGDIVRLRQILDNLIGNAIKFTSEGTVIVRASLADQGPECGLLRCDVEDSGIGIPAAVQSSIFNSFIQADTSTTRKFGGTGLGLAITKKLVELMGGEITVVSEPKKGSCFTFTAKLGYSGEPIQIVETQHEPQHEPQHQLRSASDIGQYRVLLVEDNDINIELALAMLEDLEFEVDVAENGVEAVTKLIDEGSRYDLVLMDCQMPEMDGYEATRVIRSDERYVELPIIAMTAHAMKGDREKCLAAGMSDYLTKPIDIEDFDATLKNWLTAS